MTEPERRLAAIVAADVVGYSRMMGRDEEGTLRRVKALTSELIRPKVIQHRGRFVKTTGDGFLAEFGSVFDAFNCAVEIQEGANVRNVAVRDEDAIELRIGINIGDIIFDDGDVFGDGVNIAARLEAIARPGSICVSSRAWDDLRKLQVEFEDLGEQRLKNIAQPIRAYSLSPLPRPYRPWSSLRRFVPERALLWLILAAVSGAILLAVWSLRPVGPEPTAASYVQDYISNLPCSWLRVAEHSADEDGERFRVEGASITPAALLKDAILRSSAREGFKIQGVTPTVAPVVPAQCAWLEKLRQFRYVGVPRVLFESRRIKFGDGPYVGLSGSRTELVVSLDDVRKHFALFGIEPSGDVTFLASTPGILRMFPPQQDELRTEVDSDHRGWSGIVLVDAPSEIPVKMVATPASSSRELAQFDKLAAAGNWRFELIWFFSEGNSGSQ